MVVSRITIHGCSESTAGEDCFRFRASCSGSLDSGASEFAQQDKFCTGRALNIADITFEYISSAFGRHL